MVESGAEPDLPAGSDPPAAERFVHHRPDDHETEAIDHHDDDVIDHDHDRPVNERSRLSAVESRLFGDRDRALLVQLRARPSGAPSWTAGASSYSRADASQEAVVLEDLGGPPG
jgi:hypothetical protein